MTLTGRIGFQLIDIDPHRVDMSDRLYTRLDLFSSDVPRFPFSVVSLISCKHKRRIRVCRAIPFLASGRSGSGDVSLISVFEALHL